MADRCDGVPFYIEQVVAGLSETGVPEALYEPLFARLRASANVVPVVEAAAVIGRQMDRGLLCSVVDLSDDEVDDVIDELEDALVLEPWGTDGWRFRHELLREVAAELAPPSVRRGLHAKVADALVGGAAVTRTGGWSPPTTSGPSGSTRRPRPTSRHRPTARRRGALAEARTYLTPCPRAARPRAHPARTATAARWPLRLERGFLAAAAEGYQSRAAAADFERCLQLGGTDLRDDELFATLIALTGYYVTRADLRRTAQVLESLRAGLEQGRQWFRPVIEAWFGVVAWLRGEFDAAGSHLEAATAGQAAADQHEIDAVWFASQRPDRDGAHPPGLDPPRARRSHRRRGRAGARGTPGRTARLPPGPVQPRLHALRGELGAHRSRSARPCRGTGRRPDRAGRAARLRRLAAGRGHPAGHRRRPGRTRRRRPRPDRARGSHRDHDHASSTPGARSG